MHTNARCSRVAFTLLASIVCSAGANAATWFVRADAAPGGDGTSWASAFDSLQTGLAAASSGDAIWVKAGIYRPGTNASPRTATFQMETGVDVYGGFAGGETVLSERDWHANPTVLSGDLLQNDGPNFANRGDNVYHVVRAFGISAPIPVLDGFFVRGGNANGASVGNHDRGGGILGANARLRHLTVHDNEAAFGGGLGMPNSISVQPIEDCVFRGNRAVQAGGALYLNRPDLRVSRCVLTDNEAAAGGAVRVSFSIPGSGRFENCAIVGNRAQQQAGGISSANGQLFVINSLLAFNHCEQGPGALSGTGSFNPPIRLRNAIVWDNTSGATSDPYAAQVDASVLADTSAIEGGPGPLTVDPRWHDPTGADGVPGTADDDFRLSCTSPYIDRGNNALAVGLTTDLAGAPRFADDPATPDLGSGTAPIVDLGPYEFVCACDDVEAYCTAVPNTSGLPASISASGSTSLFANSFVLHVVDGPPLKNGLFFYGASQTSVPFGDGIRCVGGSLFRLQVVALDAGGSVSFPLDVTAPPASGGPGLISEGSTWNFQYYFRDPAGGPAGWNASNAVSVTFCR